MSDSMKTVSPVDDSRNSRSFQLEMLKCLIDSGTPIAY